jgi:hypothetical protein
MTTYPDLTASAQPPAAGPADAVATGRVEWAPVPRVNLLPPEIVEGRRLIRLKKLLGGALVVVVAGCAGAVVWAEVGVSSAQREVDAAQARAATLRSTEATYAQVPRILGLIDAATTARQTVMADDVLWYGFLSDLAVAAPKGVSLLNLDVALTDSTPESSTGADPMSPAGIGQVTFSGKASEFPDVAAWLESVAGVHGLDGSTLQTATRGGAAGGAGAGGDSSVHFTSKVQVTSKALSHRYDRKAD